MAKKKKNDEIESDTDPIGMKPKRKVKPKTEAQLADLILEGRDNVQVVTVHGEPPKKRRRWLRWGLIGFGVLMVLSVLFPAKPKDTSSPQAQQVAMVTNTPRPSITPIIRETVTAEALASMVALQTQNAPTQTQITEDVVIAVTPSETGVPSDVPLPTPTAVTANVAVIMVTNTPIPSATNTETMTPTATITNTPTATITPTPTQSGVRVVTDTGVVTGQSVRVRACASTECAELNRVFNGVTFPITGSVADGQSVEGNRLWYQIEYEGQVGYVSATLVGLVSAQPVNVSVRATQPMNVPVRATQPMNVPVRATQPMNVQPVQPTQPIVAPVGNWSCSGDLYNCPDFGAGKSLSCSQLYEYMSACPNDPSRLDRDGDGRACETQCG